MPKPTLLYIHGYWGLPVLQRRKILRLYESGHDKSHPDRVYTNQWTLNIALPCGRFRICEILYAADKTLTQRLFSMFCRPPAAPSKGLRLVDDAKIKKKNYTHNEFYENNMIIPAKKNQTCFVTIASFFHQNCTTINFYL